MKIALNPLVDVDILYSFYYNVDLQASFMALTRISKSDARPGRQQATIQGEEASISRPYLCHITVPATKDACMHDVYKAGAKVCTNVTRTTKHPGWRRPDMRARNNPRHTTHSPEAL